MNTATTEVDVLVLPEVSEEATPHRGRPRGGRRDGSAAIKANPSRSGSAKPRVSGEVAGLPNSGGVSSENAPPERIWEKRMLSRIQIPSNLVWCSESLLDFETANLLGLVAIWSDQLTPGFRSPILPLV